jgi:curved DNA-binding protein CbpA
MTVSDCFRILGIPRNSCLSDLKVAYRSKAKKYHPDRNGGDGRQFTRLHEAYSLLLENGVFQSDSFNSQSDILRREAEEKSRREAFRRASEERLRKEAIRKAEREKVKREAEEKAAMEKRRREMEKRSAERRAAYEEKVKKSQIKAVKERARKLSKENSPSHKVFITGEILSGNNTDRRKLQAINTLIALKRKSAYPFLKRALYEGSEPIVLASIAAIGKLKIIQAGPELSSLMCSGSVKIRLAVLDAIAGIGRNNLYTGIVNMALRDNDSSVRRQAEFYFKRIYG